MKTEEETLANNYIKLIHQVTVHVQIHIMPKTQSPSIQAYGTYLYEKKHVEKIM